MRLRTFGGIRIEGAPQALGGAAAQRRPLALLALLAAAGETGMSREKLLALLWPESDTEHARNALRQTLYALRRDLDAPELLLGVAELRLNPAVMASDLADFDRAVEARDFGSMMSLYTGPFLDGFHVGDAPEFERWARAERARRADEYAGAVEALARAAARRGDLQDAVAYWRRLAGHNPLNSRIALELMRALAAVGDRAGAIRHAAIHEALLRQEIDAAPDAAVATLAEQLRRAEQGPQTRADGVPPGPVEAPHPRAEAARSHEPPTLAAAAGVADAAVNAPVGSASYPSRRKATTVAMLGLTAIALVGLAVATASRRPETKLERTLVAVAPYEVYDPAMALWREGLMDILSHTLDGAGPLRTVAPSVSVRQWRGATHQSAAEELSRRTGAGIVISGYLMRAGNDSVRAVTSIVDATSHRVVEVERREAAARMDRLTDSLTIAILRAVDEWLPIGAVRRTPLGRAGSMEALKAFLRGEQFYRRSQWDSASVAYSRVIAHDSTFALAFRRLGEVIGWQRLITDSLAQAYKLRAGALNHGLNPRDSLLVLADSLEAATSKAPTPLEEWPFARRLLAMLNEAVRRYPEDPEMWYALGEARYHLGYGPVLGVSGRSTLDAFDRAIALDSAFGPAYIHTPELGLDLGGPPLARRYIDAYLRHHPAERAEPFIRLVGRILAPGATPSLEVDRLPPTVPAEDILSMRTATRHWVDSSETAVRLARRVAAGVHRSRYGTYRSKDFLARVLAEQLAFRGHLREARRVIGGVDEAIAFELAYVGGAPEDSTRATIARLVRRGSVYSTMALPWWARRGDSVALRAFLERARQRLEASDGQLSRLRATYDTAAAQAYLSLVRSDTAGALRRFTALPDTLCARCYLDRLTRASLLSAHGRHREALAQLAEPLTTIVSPVEVLFTLERGRVSERLGQREAAARAYQFVVDAWRRGDPDVQPFVVEARRGLARMQAGRAP